MIIWYIRYYCYDHYDHYNRKIETEFLVLISSTLWKSSALAWSSIILIVMIIWFGLRIVMIIMIIMIIIIVMIISSTLRKSSALASSSRKSFSLRSFSRLTSSLTWANPVTWVTIPQLKCSHFPSPGWQAHSTEQPLLGPAAHQSSSLNWSRVFVIVIVFVFLQIDQLTQLSKICNSFLCPTYPIQKSQLMAWDLEHWDFGPTLDCIVTAPVLQIMAFLPSYIIHV